MAKVPVKLQWAGQSNAPRRSSSALHVSFFDVSLSSAQGRLLSGQDIFGPLINKFLLNNTHKVCSADPDLQMTSCNL